MKFIFCSLFYFFVLILNAQLIPAPGVYSKPNKEIVSISGNRDVIWSEDFVNGFDNGWSSAEMNGIAHWEYRGVSTDPNVEVGTRGSCLPANTLGEPIASPTWQNGFMIFDSNWWDNPSNPCSPDFYGTGPAPAPHIAMLTSPVIDLSGVVNVALVFNQYLKLYTGETRVEVSSDGLNWIGVFTNSAVPNPTLPDDQQIIQITPYAAGQSTFQFRFVFDGFYYFWQLDDIALIDTYANDLALSGSTYGDFDLYDPAHPTGYEFMEYTKYPDEMPPNLKFSTNCQNLGGNIQNDCRLNVEVYNGITDEVLFNGQSAEGFLLVPGQSQELRSGSFQMPSTISKFNAVYQSSQTESEQDPSNNTDTLTFFINDVQYARDHLFTTAVYLGIPDYADTQYEIGNIFLVTADNLTCHSISAAVGIGSSTPANIYGALYSFDISTGINATLIATTPAIALSPEMFNTYGEHIMVNLTFNTPIPVSAGTAYFVAVGSTAGIDNFVCSMSGNAEEATAFVRFFPQDWFYLDMVPMVRMNFDFFDEVQENSESMANLIAYPVPANDILNVNLEDWKNESCTLQVFDSMGRKARTESVFGFTSTYQFNVASLQSGIYELVVYSNKKRSKVKFIKE